ncbi:MAG: hypothetical protein KGI79_01265 [Patescibacteria group bacterium]|nr:hypothetical protein [Patescibacteria group bacterium]MDE2116487.1 hypothetical protein [Patescibacteria group bacterium]
MPTLTDSNLAKTIEAILREQGGEMGHDRLVAALMKKGVIKTPSDRRDFLEVVGAMKLARSIAYGPNGRIMLAA